jgi:transcriptional regulator with XRE-family HTH domain
MKGTIPLNECQQLSFIQWKGKAMVRETGNGKTPERVVFELNKKLNETSLNAISKATGVGISALHRYQRGIGEPTTATLEKLSNYFGVSVANLRGEEPTAIETMSEVLSYIFNKVKNENPDLSPEVQRGIGFKMFIHTALLGIEAKKSNAFQDIDTGNPEITNKILKEIDVRLLGTPEYCEIMQEAIKLSENIKKQ